MRAGTRIGSMPSWRPIPSCTAGPCAPSEAKVPGAAAQHRDKDPRRRLLQPLDMADHLVDPHRGLVAEGRGHRVLAVGAAGDRHVGAALGEVGHRPERVGDQPQKDLGAPAAVRAGRRSG